MRACGPPGLRSTTAPLPLTCDRHVARAGGLPSPTVRIWSRHAGVADAPARAQVELRRVRELERVHGRAHLRRRHALLVDQASARALSPADAALPEAVVAEACVEHQREAVRPPSAEDAATHRPCFTRGTEARARLQVTPQGAGGQISSSGLPQAARSFDRPLTLGRAGGACRPSKALFCLTCRRRQSSSSPRRSCARARDPAGRRRD